MTLTDAIANYMLIVLTLTAFNTVLLVALVLVVTRKGGEPDIIVPAARSEQGGAKNDNRMTRRGDRCSAPLEDTSPEAHLCKTTPPLPSRT